MHSESTKKKFILLRASGLSFQKISKILKVSKQTLLQWNVSLSPFIKLYHQTYTEFVKEELNFTFKERLKSLKKFCDSIDSTLTSRNLSDVKTETLLKFKFKYLSLIENFIYQNDFLFVPTKSNTPSNFEYTREIINPNFESEFEKHFPELFDFKSCNDSNNNLKFNSNAESNSITYNEKKLNGINNELIVNGNGKNIKLNGKEKKINLNGKDNILENSKNGFHH